MTKLSNKTTINIKGKLINLESPKVMGILNITPDSFYDGGVYSSDISILNKVEKMLLDRASFIDIGAYSSKPNTKHISENEETKRLLPIIELVANKFPEAIISIDTFRSTIARQAIEQGGHIINDISGGLLDDKMFSTVASMNVPYIIMHMRGTPQTMQKMTRYNNLIKEVCHYFSERIHLAKNCGISDIIIDCGFGFSKTLEQNYNVLKNLDIIKSITRLPLMVGLSRKSMIYKLLDISIQDALNGTTALHMMSLIKGANIIRVHDVKEAVETVTLFNQLYKNLNY